MAIAYDNASQGNTTLPGLSLTLSHTTSGSNRILFAGILTSGTNQLSGVTYAGDAMTSVGSTQVGTTTIYLYYLINPASGANDIVATASGIVDIDARVASYTGARQSSVPDASVVNTQLGSQTSITTTVTTIADNCWLVGFYRNNAGNYAAGTATTIRNTATSDPIADSNGAKTPPGSFSLNLTCSSATVGGIMASFAPALPGPANVKTWDGLAFTSVKTINGLAVGSIKSVNGVT